MIATVNEELTNEIRDQIKPVYEIIREDHSKHKLTFYVQPRLTTTMKQIMDLRVGLLSKYCNAPYTMWSDFENHRMTLGCN